MKFENYPEYKETGVNWLGTIPSHWELSKVNFLFNLGRGRVISHQDLNENGLFPVYSSQTKNNGCLGYINTFDYDCEQITWTTDGANAGTVFLRSGKHNCTNVCGTLQPKLSMNIRYYAYYLSSVTIHYKRPDTNGAKIMNNEMSRIICLNLPISEQSEIVDFLDKETTKINNLISKQEQLIQLLIEQRKSIISHAVTKGLNPNAAMKDSGIEWLNEVPEHWELKPIKFIAKTNQYSLSEQTDPNLVIKYIDIGSVSYTNGVEKTETMLFSEAPSRARKIVHYGDIIVSTVRTYLKAIAYIDEGLDGMIASTGFAVITPNEKIINPHFAKYAFLSQAFIDEVIAKSKGISYPAINSTDLINIKIPIPSLSEQNKIITFLTDESFKIDKLIVKEKLLIEKLKEYRSSIISHAVTGKIDVREAL